MRARRVVAGLTGTLLAVTLPALPAAAGAQQPSVPSAGSVAGPRMPGFNRLISISPAGLPGNGNSCINHAISRTGRYVVFASESTNLIPGGVPALVPPVPHLYLRDTATGRTELLDRTRTGVLADRGAGDGSGLSVSADGRYVAFASLSNNLAGGGGNLSSVYVHDRMSGANRLVSTSYRGGRANAESVFAELSDDGAKVLFWSRATDLLPGVTSSPHLYVRDLRTGVLSLVTKTPDGRPSRASAAGGSLSGDGRYVAFASDATDLVPGLQGGTGKFHIFVRDLQTGTVTVLRRRDGVAVLGGPADISRDGRYVAFSASGSAVKIPTTAPSDTFVYDRVADRYELISRNSNGVPADQASIVVDISDDGNSVVLQSTATNLVPPLRLDGVFQKGFLHDRQAGTTQLVGVRDDGAVLPEPTVTSISGDGRTVVFRSGAPAVKPYTQHRCDVYTRTRP